MAAKLSRTYSKSSLHPEDNQYLNVTLTGDLQDKDFYLCHVPGKEVHPFAPDALSRLCENHMLSNESEKPAHKRHQAFLASIEPIHRIPNAVFKQIAAHILVMIDAFSGWVELFSTKTTGASEAAACIFQHFGRFGTPDVIHTNQGPAVRNEQFSELARMSKVEHSFERANQEVMSHLLIMLFDARVHDKWSFEQLPMAQRIMNTVEKTSTGVTHTELILNNSIRLSNRILAPGSANTTSRVALSDTVDNWVARQHTLLQACDTPFSRECKPRNAG